VAVERKQYLAYAYLFLLVAAGFLVVYHQHVSGKNFCTAESRNVDACITLYQPVCGFTRSSHETFTNGCFACMDPSVIYWTEGEC
jgi:hypothetical protein